MSKPATDTSVPREGDRVRYGLRHIADIPQREGIVTAIGRGGWDDEQVYVVGNGHSAWIDVSSFDPTRDDAAIIAHVIA